MTLTAPISGRRDDWISFIGSSRSGEMCFGGGGEELVLFSFVWTYEQAGRVMQVAIGGLRSSLDRLIFFLSPSAKKSLATFYQKVTILNRVRISHRENLSDSRRKSVHPSKPRRDISVKFDRSVHIARQGISAMFDNHINRQDISETLVFT